MLCFTLPVEPQDFARSVALARSAINVIIARGEHPKSRDFSPGWQSFKQAFQEVQHGKCGYCEHDTAVSYHGDLEHFAPKAGIDEICQSPSATSVSGSAGETPPHPVERICERGYWWLAYIWRNYLFACARCNQVHKRCIFPVDPPRPPRSPAPDVIETRLLLNPYEPGLKPADHLWFSDQGEIFDRSPRGWETIRTCRLDRIALTTARRDKARRTYKLTEQLWTALEQESLSLQYETIEDLRALGDETRPFAGMVRIIFEHETQVSWSDAMTALCRPA